MRKRLLSLLLCLVILGSALPVQAKADTLTLPPPVDLKWGENMRSAWPSLYDDDTDFDMPDVISWDTTNLCDLAGQQISADCIIYRKSSSSGGTDERVSEFSVSMWPDAYAGEQFSYKQGACVSEYLSRAEYWSETGKCCHLKSGDYYFTLQYTGHSNLADSAVVKSEVWHYTQPAEKLVAPTNLKFTNGTLSWTQPDGKTNQVVGYHVMVYGIDDDSCFEGLYDNKCSVDIASYLDGKDDDYAFNFKVTALSRDITAIQGSEWSESSAVFHKNETAARSASLTGTIHGKVHQQINAEISLSLTGDSFDPSQIEGYNAESGTLPAGTELTDYLTLVNPEHSEFYLFNEADLKKGDQMMAVRVMGISSQNYNGQVNMTISDQILTSGKELAVTPSDDCMWHITAQTTPSQPEEEKYDLWFFGKQVTVDNATDILGDGAAAFDSLTNTLTLCPGSGNSYGVAGNTPMLKSELSSLTLRVEKSVTLSSQDGFGIEAKNLTVEIADPDAALTVIGKTGAFSQTPLNVTKEIFAGEDESSATQKSDWTFGPTTTPYVRLGVHKWDSRWRWNTMLNVHWRKCEHAACAAIKDAAKHTLGWWTDVNPYGATPGSGHVECQVCGYKGEAETVHGTAPDIMTDSLLSSELGMTYRSAVEAIGTAPLTWKITSGKLPDGLTLNTKTGEITGKSTKAGTFTFTVQVTNQVPGASAAQRSYTIKIDEASNELRFVKRVTKNALKNADADSRENIENAIYNLIFKAQYCPTGATKSVGNKENAKFTGTKAALEKYPVQNKSAFKSQVTDNKLGTMHFSEAGAGCMAYALYCTTYTYSYSGKSYSCSNRSAAGIKEFIHKWADPGEQLRYIGGKKYMHSIVFLGESDDGKGIYCLSYGGGVNPGYKTRHTLEVEYRTYASLAEKSTAEKSTSSLTVRDTNGGSYLEGTAKKWSEVKAEKGNKKAKTIIRLNCPVEASVTLDGFVLDSEYGPFERSFGTVTRDGDGIVFTLDYSEDYVLDIRGTGEGTMDAEIEYLDGDGVPLGSQKFENMPITSDTAITSGALTPESVVVLYYLEDDVPVSAWGTNLGETATEPSEDFLSVNNTPDEEDEEESTSSGSSGGSAAASNVITVDIAVGGSVTVSSKTAAKGDTITVAVRPDVGYSLDTLTVTDQNGTELKLTNKGNGTFTFPMPASRVTVKATFKPAAFLAFTDVPSNAYYEDAVNWAVDKGITTGVSANRFDPDGICTRAQAAAFLWRAAGSPAPKSSAMPFIDVPAGSYYYDAVLWAVENGITKGTSDTTFSPNMTCTRAQIVTFLWRSQNAPAAGSSNPFTDVAASDYYADAVLWAVKENVTKGTGNTTFSPDDNCTRAQIVTFIWRTMA